MIKNISIVIPTFKRYNILIKSLKPISVLRSKYNIEVIVVNDDSTSEIELPDEFSFVKVVKNPKNGVASARNLGVSISKNDWVLFLDDDIIITEQALLAISELGFKDEYKIHFPNWEYPEEMNEIIRNSVFGKYLTKASLTSFKGYLGHANKDHWKNDSIFEINSGASYFLLINKKIFESIGGYNEQFPFAGFEDYDLPKRLFNIGVRFFVVPNITVFHNEEDRLEIEKWLQRKYNGAITRKVAVNMGYRELDPRFSETKKIVYSIIIPFIKIIKFILNYTRKFNSLDSLSFKLINLLEGIQFYRGFYLYKKTKG